MQLDNNSAELISSVLIGLLPPNLAQSSAVAITSIAKSNSQLHLKLLPQQTQQLAMTKQHNWQFINGRYAARLAIENLNKRCESQYSSEVLQRETGLPVFAPGLFGSISHSDNLAVAAVCNQAPAAQLALGIDIQYIYPLKMPILRKISTATTIGSFAPAFSCGQAIKLDENALIVRLFSVKEAAYKMYFTLFANRANERVYQLPQDALKGGLKALEIKFEQSANHRVNQLQSASIPRSFRALEKSSQQQLSLVAGCFKAEIEACPHLPAGDGAWLIYRQEKALVVASLCFLSAD